METDEDCMETENAWAENVKQAGDLLASMTLAEAVNVDRYLKATYPEMEAFDVLPTGRLRFWGCGSAYHDIDNESCGASSRSEFAVVYEGLRVPSRKISVIKTIRELTGSGLAEAKGISEGEGLTLFRGLPKHEADAIKQKLEAAGAFISLR